MIQVIQPTPGIGSMFGQGLSQGISSGVEKYYEQQKQQKELSAKTAKIDEFIEKYGKDWSPEQQGIVKGIGLGVIPESIGKGLMAELAARPQQSPLQQAVAGPQVPGQEMQEQAPPIRSVPTPEEINRVGAWDPNRAKLMSEERKIASKEGIANRSDLLKYQDEAQANLTRENNQIRAIDTQLASVRSGDVGVWSKANLANMLKDAGHATLASAVETQGSKAFKTAGKELMTGMKAIFGSVISDQDVKRFEDMMAEVGANEKANELSLKSLRVPHMVEQERARYRLDLINRNPTLDALQLNNLTFKHMQRYEEDLLADWKDTLNAALKLSPTAPKEKGGERRPTLEEIFGTAPA